MQTLQQSLPPQIIYPNNGHEENQNHFSASLLRSIFASRTSQAPLPRTSAPSAASATPALCRQRARIAGARRSAIPQARAGRRARRV